jgi:hypothetical protein
MNLVYLVHPCSSWFVPGEIHQFRHDVARQIGHRFHRFTVRARAGDLVSASVMEILEKKFISSQPL